MVAMSGAIMPDPLMKPTSATFTPPITASRQAALGKVSVVPMAAVTSSQLAPPSAAWAARTPDIAFSCGSGTPITPVEAANTSAGSQPIRLAASATCRAQASAPVSPVNALEFPAFTTSPRAAPQGKWRRHSSTSGDGHFDRVVTPATVVPGSKASKVTSARVQGL